MTDELKERFQQLVADPPPPTAVPSEAVFARVRTVRRRRTAGVAISAAAAVAVVTVVAGGLTDIRSGPPVSGQPSNKAATTSPPPPAPPKIGATVTLIPTVKGRVVTMKVTVAGTVLVPIGADDHKPLPTNVGLIDLGLGSDYSYGDGSEPGGSDGGAITCQGAKIRKTAKETYTLLDGPHVFTKPGTFTFTYRISFCGGPKGSFTAAKTAKIVVR
ncbi:hypothetical protein OHA70_02745 [Kribbella sp. NBC_00382]|uniref:hypothetical protein n=1 Tax=Kribbella sp. NBC_00382 TaxID=2975967 RepID=UPI002E1A655C